MRFCHFSSTQHQLSFVKSLKSRISTRLHSSKKNEEKMHYVTMQGDHKHQRGVWNGKTKEKFCANGEGKRCNFPYHKNSLRHFTDVPNRCKILIYELHFPYILQAYASEFRIGSTRKNGNMSKQVIAATCPNGRKSTASRPCLSALAYLCKRKLGWRWTTQRNTNSE